MSKRIDLDGTYFIDIDDCNWILKKSVPTQATRKGGQPSTNAGKMHDVILGYFPRLEIALKHYADGLEKDEIFKAREPVNVQGLQAILLRIEKLCKGLKLVEIDANGEIDK